MGEGEVQNQISHGQLELNYETGASNLTDTMDIWGMVEQRITSLGGYKDVSLCKFTQLFRLFSLMGYFFRNWVVLGIALSLSLIYIHVCTHKYRRILH